jgi:hypothetical protein
VQCPPNKKTSRRIYGGKFFDLQRREAIIERAEHVTNDRAKQHEHSNDNDSYQNKNERVLDQALAAFEISALHLVHLLSVEDKKTVAQQKKKSKSENLQSPFSKRKKADV